MIFYERIAVSVRKRIHSEYYLGCLTEKLQYCLFVKQLEKLDSTIRSNMEIIGREIILTCCLLFGKVTAVIFFFNPFSPNE